MSSEPDKINFESHENNNSNNNKKIKSLYPENICKCCLPILDEDSSNIETKCIGAIEYKE
jgi:hypothetical protein